jgi:membrane protein
VSSPRRIVRETRARAATVSERGKEWADRQDHASYRGVGVGAWRRYRDVDGPQQSALLAVYVLVAVLPALLVMEEYLEANPAALANDLVRHFGFSPPTARALRGVLVQSRTHELGSALLAIVGALLGGLGFGRVLQVVHVRAWRLPLPAREIDLVRFAAVIGGVYGLILLLLVQLNELAKDPPWIGLALTPAWVALLVAFFVWVPRLVTHRMIAARDLLPAAVLTAVGLVALMFVSSLLMEPWVDLYARDYGGLGVVMAIFFWIAIAAGIIVAAASLSPALAERRTLRAAPAD